MRQTSCGGIVLCLLLLPCFANPQKKKPKTTEPAFKRLKRPTPRRSQPQPLPPRARHGGAQPPLPAGQAWPCSVWGMLRTVAGAPAQSGPSTALGVPHSLLAVALWVRGAGQGASLPAVSRGSLRRQRSITGGAEPSAVSSGLCLWPRAGLRRRGCKPASSLALPLGAQWPGPCSLRLQGPGRLACPDWELRPSGARSTLARCEPLSGRPGCREA